MIHLDTSLLIGASDATDAHHHAARTVLAFPLPCAASAIAWAEFHSWPLPTPLTLAIRHLLKGGIIPFDEAAAQLAGNLFFQTHTKRSNRMDSMIAASAIVAGASLATANEADFAPFVRHGLTLHPIG